MVTFDYLPEFERRAKALAKKYRSFVDDYNTFLDELERNPFSGTPLGGNTYKHRMAIASKGKGKSGGAALFCPCIGNHENSQIVLTNKL